MSKIQEIAVAIREVTRVIQLAEDRVALLKSYGEDKMVEGGTGLFALITNAERVSKDAHNLRSAFELEMATHVPETVADVLAQVLVVRTTFIAGPWIPATTGSAWCASCLAGLLRACD